MFPKTKFESQNPRLCQHNWFDNYLWLHYDIGKDCVVYSYCVKNISKLTEENNKKPAYTSVGFKNWKKVPQCFKDHRNSKCHKATATLAVIIHKQTGLVQNWKYQRMMYVTNNLDDLPRLILFTF